MDPDLQSPHYLTSAQYLGKDYIVAAGTDRSIVKIIDRHAKTVLANIKEIGAVYDVDVASKGQLAGNKFIVTSRHNIINLDFNK